MVNQKQMNKDEKCPKQENCGGLIVKRVTKVGKQKVYDITVADNHHYILENGVVCHNTGIYYSANAVWIIGRSQEKEGTEVVGYNFTINIEKSRYVKEKMKCPFTVTFDGGINRWSGLMDIALETGHCTKPKNGWYQRQGDEKNYRLADTNCKEFWIPVLTDKTFQTAVQQKFQLGTAALIQEHAEHVDHDGEA